MAVDQDQLPAPMAEHDTSTGGNPVRLKAADYAVLYRKAIKGEL